MSSESSASVEPVAPAPAAEPPAGPTSGGLTAALPVSTATIPETSPPTERPADVEEDPSTKEPSAKKLKLSPEAEETRVPIEYKLEERLNGILCCVVCLDLPNMTIYQCTNGHLMCASCLWHLLADARLKDEPATCPSCRCEINRTLCVRNLAVEKAISELPCNCQFCSGQMPRHKLANHESHVCKDRLVHCTYERLGCQWSGAYRELEAHEGECQFPLRNGAELMASIGEINEGFMGKLKFYQNMLDFFSHEKVSFADLQLRPYRTDDFIPKLYYETMRFTAFSITWVVRARINDNNTTGNPVLAATRSIGYQLVAKTKPVAPVRMMFFILKGPFGESAIEPVTYESDFSGETLESAYYELPIKDPTAVNKLVAAKMINIRLVLIQLPK